MRGLPKAKILGFILLLLTAALCAAADAAEIKKVTISDYLVEFDVDGTFTYTIYNTDPYRVSVDLPQVDPGKFEGKIPSKSKGLTEVDISKKDKSTHIELVLDRPADVKPGFKGNIFALSISAPAPKEEAKEEPKAEEGTQPEALAQNTPAPEEETPPSAETEEQKEEAAPPQAAEEPRKELPIASEVTGITFQQEQNKLKLLIQGNGRMEPNVFSLPNRIVLDIAGVKLKAQPPKEVVLPIKGVRSGSYPDKLRLVIDLSKNVNYEVLSKDDYLALIIPIEAQAAPAPAPEARKPQAAAPQKAKEAEKKVTAEGGVEGYTGQKISLDFQSADIVPIFMLLGEVSGYNVVVHPSVSGTITLKLKDVPWDQALQLLLDTFSLGREVEGNVMKIAPLAQFAQWKQDKEKLRETDIRTEGLKQEVIKLNYATAGELSTAINNAKLLSPRGNITTDARMNTLIIKDVPSSIAGIRDLVSIMDVSKPQVMIEAQIVEVNSTYAENLGIRWGSELNINQANNENFNVAVNPPMMPATIAGMRPDATPAITPSTATLTIGTANALRVQMNLEALETVGKSRRLANPRVLTIDNEAASIQQGTSIPVQTTTAEGTSTTFVNANLNLTVTPRITPEGYVQLKVTAANDSLGTLTPQGFAIDRKNVATQAIVKNGDTLVLGGIYTNTESVSDQQVPFLGRIPLLGWLFRTRTKTGPNPSELLILITPKIVPVGSPS